MNINITKEELQKKYEEELDNYLDQCDWVNYVDSELVCYLVKIVLKRYGLSIDSNELHKLYLYEISTLNLKFDEWRYKFGIKEIISMIYDIIEKKF